MMSEGGGRGGHVPRSVLVRGDGFTPQFGDVAGVSEDASLRLLALEFSPRVTTDLDAWERRLGRRPSELAVVTAGPGEGATETEHPVKSVSSPADLTGIGMATTKFLADWEAAPGTPVVVLDSLTVLLQYTSTRSLYQFLHALTVRIGEADAHGLFHLDPATQDEKTVHTLASLFDAVADQTDDGEWRLRTR